MGANAASVSPNSSARDFPFEPGKSPMTTLAPCLTNLSTVPRPKPEAPPVTKATVPYKATHWYIEYIVPSVHAQRNVIDEQARQYEQTTLPPTFIIETSTHSDRRETKVGPSGTTVSPRPASEETPRIVNATRHTGFRNAKTPRINHRYERIETNTALKEKSERKNKKGKKLKNLLNLESNCRKFHSKVQSSRQLITDSIKYIHVHMRARVSHIQQMTGIILKCNKKQKQIKSM